MDFSSQEDHIKETYWRGVSSSSSRYTSERKIDSCHVRRLLKYRRASSSTICQRNRGRPTINCSIRGGTLHCCGNANGAPAQYMRVNENIILQRDKDVLHCRLTANLNQHRNDGAADLKKCFSCQSSCFTIHRWADEKVAVCRSLHTVGWRIR